MKKPFFILLSFILLGNLAFSQCLIADYSFDGTATDISGNGYSGSVFGATPTTDRFGNQNSAYYFDGDGDYIDISALADKYRESVSALTVSFWVSFADTSSTDIGKTIISLSAIGEDIHSNFFEIELEHHQLQTETETGYGINNEYHLNGLPNPNEWILMTCVYDNDSVRYYQNSEFITSFKYKPVETTVNRLYIGGFAPDTNAPCCDFYGKLDELKIFDCVLTQEEIDSLYQPAETQCLVANYPLDNDADDISGNEFNGTVYGATPTIDSEGNQNSAYFFDGEDDYIDLNSALLPTDGSDWSVKLTFRAMPQSNNEHKVIFAQYDLYEGRFHLFVQNNVLKLFSSANSGATTIAKINSSWNNVTLSCKDSILTVYLNNRLVADNILIAPIYNTNTWLGDDGSSIPNRFFKGIIDNVEISHCALTQEEIEESYMDLSHLAKNEKFKPEVLLYPNPTNDVVKIASKNGLMANYRIYDITGKLVFGNNVKSSYNEIDISKLPQGTYFLKLKIEQTIVTKKFMKINN